MEPQRPFLLDRRGPARLDDGGRKRVDDDRGAGDGAAGREVGALVERDSMLGARQPCGDGLGFGFTRGGGGGQRRGSIARFGQFAAVRSEENTSELQSLMSLSYAVFCLKKKKKNQKKTIRRKKILSTNKAKNYKT